MRAIFATTVGVFALMGGAVQAAEAPIGYLGVSGGGANIDAGSAGELDADLTNIQGLVRLPLGPQIGLELAAESTQFDGDAITSGTARLMFDVGPGRLGGFVGGTSADGFDLSGGGVEGRFNLSPNWRLDALAGAASGDADAWAGRGELRIFLSDNSRIDGFANFVSFDTGGGGEDGWTFGFGGEHQFGGAPVSVFGRAEHGELNDVDIASDSFRIGVRWNFGGGTLRDRDMDGQSSPGFTDLFGGDLLPGLLAAPSSPPPPPPPPPPSGDA
ncbi:MAG: hypothetical protein Q8L23_17200 [Caulobacter sp.]|nr:hypothetical protein [Caulobacter sp.]